MNFACGRPQRGQPVVSPAPCGATPNAEPSMRSVLTSRGRSGVPPRPKAHLVDTNIILRYLVGDTPAQAGKSAALMERLEEGAERAEILESVIAEAVWTLESFYKVPRPEIAERLAAIVAFRGVLAAKKGVLIKALARFGSTSADFVDCLLAAQAQQRNQTVYSFDAKDFRRLGIAWEGPA
ncbi:MAG: PIN domain nuclease [Candidatus Rokuibacteriota bacterium]|nr:MAG: PIN domain nuclease [Candidatus Rokubacteria bacterium]